MHSFNSEDVFRLFYREACIAAAKNAFKVSDADTLLLPAAFLHKIAVYLKHFHGLFEQRGIPAAAIHKDTITRHRDLWLKTFSSETCLSCMVRRPTDTGKCGHCFCDTCVKIFGEEDEKHYYMNDCILCGGNASIQLRKKPPTSGRSCLVIGGGGCCGIIALVILALLQIELDVDVPIQDFFDIATGTSAGALSLLAMYNEGWSVDTCAVQFKALSQKAFNEPSKGNIWKWMCSVISDSLHSHRGIKLALQDVYKGRKFLDPNYANEIGTKLVIVSATVKDPIPCLFTNFNLAPCPGYIIPNCRDVKTWEVYLPVKHCKGIGTLQDGGALHNNPNLPADLAFNSTARFKDELPNIILNIGSGSPAPLVSQTEKCKGIMDAWFFRLPRAQLSQMRSDRSWEQYKNSKTSSVKERMYRLDTTLKHIPGLDDSTEISKLVSIVLQDDRLKREIKTVAWRLFATNFYFEPTQLPVKAGTNFSITGEVRCINMTDKIRKKMEKVSLVINGKSIPMETEINCGGRLSIPLIFIGPDQVDISLSTEGIGSFPISGMPCSIKRLINLYDLRSHFSTRYHKRKALEDVFIRPGRRRRLLKKFA